MLGSNSFISWGTVNGTLTQQCRKSCFTSLTYGCWIMQGYDHPSLRSLASNSNATSGPSWRNGIMLASQVSDLGSMSMPDNQRWLWGSSHASDKKVQALMNSCWPWNPWAESSEAQNRGYQWPNKMHLGPTKTLKKERNHVFPLTF